jgi:hypothetical protein
MGAGVAMKSQKRPSVGASSRILLRTSVGGMGRKMAPPRLRTATVCLLERHKLHFPPLPPPLLPPPLLLHPNTSSPPHLYRVPTPTPPHPPPLPLPPQPVVSPKSTRTQRPPSSSADRRPSLPLPLPRDLERGRSRCTSVRHLPPATAPATVPSRRRRLQRLPPSLTRSLSRRFRLPPPADNPRTAREGNRSSRTSTLPLLLPLPTSPLHHQHRPFPSRLPNRPRL